MFNLEESLRESIRSIDGKINRIKTLTELLESIFKINKITSESTSEEYYLEQINNWMDKYKRKSEEAEEKERKVVQKEKEYLLLLKKIKVLEKSAVNIKDKYEYYKLHR